MAPWVPVSSRCALCAWQEPRENLQDIRTFTESEPLTYRNAGDVVRAHDFCWQRLMKHFDQPPCLKLLIRTLRETAKPNYREGKTSMDCPSHLDWMYRKVDKVLDIRRPPELRSGIKEMGRKDISVFIKARTTRRNHSIPRWMKINYETVSQTDVFLCLPLEIRTLIAGYLCTPDFLRLRLSSRAMALLFESQQFWRTRFLVHGERGYLHFLTDRQESYQGWRLLYRGTNSTHAWPLKFNDWKKQWLINQTIHDRYLMNVLEEEGLSPSLTNNKAESNRPQWPWVQIHWKRYLTQCQMYQRNFPYCNTLLPMPSPGLFGAQRLGCCKSCGSFGHPPTNRKIMVAHPIIKIRFSVLVENERIFLTGFDLIHGSDIPDTSFGYKVPGREILSDLHGQPLRGFRIKTKVPSVAISDICPIIETSEGEDADHGWIGDHGSLVAYREKAGSITGSIRVPSGKENIVGISGYFQGRLLVGLALGCVSDSSAMCGIL